MQSRKRQPTAPLTISQAPSRLFPTAGPDSDPFITDDEPVGLSECSSASSETAIASLHPVTPIEIPAGLGNVDGNKGENSSSLDPNKPKGLVYNHTSRTVADGKISFPVIIAERFGQKNSSRSAGRAPGIC